MLFLWSRIICMSQQVDVMIIQHQWSHKKQLRKCSQLLTKYLQAQIVPVTFQIPTDTKRWAKSLLRIKKCQHKKVVFRLKYISMQGGYTELMMEQIKNSQEDNQTDWNTQVKFIIPVHKNYNSYICKLHTYVQCNFSITVL